MRSRGRGTPAPSAAHGAAGCVDSDLSVVRPSWLTLPLSANGKEPAFLSFLDAMYAPVLARLSRFTQQELCGEYNERLSDDLQNDRAFRDAARQLHDNAVSSHFGDAAPVIDTFSIANVAISHAESIAIRFTICFFTETLGHSSSPAEYRLSRDPSATKIHITAYGCGIRDQNGRFWYPRTDRACGQADSFPRLDSDWAVHVRRRYGETSLARHIRSRSSGR